MKVYFHEHGRRSFYCATAPTASETAEQFLRDGGSASSVGVILF